jgi:hypothetical protein
VEALVVALVVAEAVVAEALVVEAVVAVVPVVVGNHSLIAQQRNDERHENSRIPSQTLAQG